MRHDLPFDEIADAVGLATPAFAEKDYYVVQALSAVSRIAPVAPFKFIFTGGTCLTKAHGVTERMSEDIDLKIATTSDHGLSGNAMKNALRGLRGSLCDALVEQGFQVDPDDRQQVEVHKQGKFVRINLDYTSAYGEEGQLRPHIQIEADLRSPKLEPVALKASSFAARALDKTPEVEQILCITIPEVTAEKLVALLWRVFSRSVNEGPDYNKNDNRLVRHIYDLHMISGHTGPGGIKSLAREIALQDAQERTGQAPTFAADPENSLIRAAEILMENETYSKQYADFTNAMVYGDKPPYEEALASVQALARDVWGS